MSTYITYSPNQTFDLGRKLAKKLLKQEPLKRGAFVLALQGELGSGKTTFLQGFAKGLGIKEKITSPTFVIMKKFKIPSKKNKTGSKYEFFYHLDCYRLEKPKELYALGWKEIVGNRYNIVAVEWAERIRHLVPKSSLWIKFLLKRKNERKIVTGHNSIL